MVGSEFAACYDSASKIVNFVENQGKPGFNLDEESKRNFYIKETINSKWSVRELQRQRDSLLYERLTLSADKSKILELAK